MIKSSPIIWLLGLSGAGKTTLGKALVNSLAANGVPVEFMDGDIMRSKTGTVGFERSERLTHLRSMSEMAKTASLSGKVVIAAFITPYEDARRYLRKNCPGYIEVWVSTPLAECERRDTKGLYAKAREGKIKNFTGIDDPFETPTDSDITVETWSSVEESLSTLLSKLNEQKVYLNFLSSLKS